MNRILKWAWVGILCGLSVAPLAAQGDDSVSRVAVQFFASARYDATAGQGLAVGRFDVELDWEKPNGDSAVSTISGTVPSAGLPSYTGAALQTLSLDVGREYLVRVSTSYIRDVTVKIVPPAGYEVYMQNRLGKFYTLSTVDPDQTSSFMDMVSLRIVPEGARAAGGQAGSSSSLATGGAYWRIYMGYLPNGLSAGYLQLSDTGRGSEAFSDVFNADALTYAPPSPDIHVYEAPSSVSGERQIFAYEAGVNIKPLASPRLGYSVAFYRNAQVKDRAVGGVLPMTFTGAPFVTYTIERDGDSQHVKITRSARTNDVEITKVAGLARTGTWPAYTWTTSDWHSPNQSALVTAQSVWTPASQNSINPADPAGYTDAAGMDHREDITISSTAGGLPLKSHRDVAAMPWGESVTYSRRGSDQPETSTHRSYANAADVGSYARTKLVKSNSGAWRGYEYFPATFDPLLSIDTSSSWGLVKRQHGPYKNTAAPAVESDLSTRTDGVIVTYDYADNVYTLYNGRSLRPISEVTTIDGITVGRATTQYADSAITVNGRSLPLVTATRKDYESSASTEQNARTTVTKFFAEVAISTHPQTLGQYVPMDPFWRSQVHSILKPDGTKQAFAYQRGTYVQGATLADSGFSVDNTAYTVTPAGEVGYFDRTAAGSPAASRITIVSGTSISTAGAVYVSPDGYPADTLYLVAGKSTKSVTIRDASALVRRTELWVWNVPESGSPQFELISAENYTYDDGNNLVNKVSLNGSVYSALFEGGRKVSETDAAGIKITYDYDDAGRVQTVTKLKAAANASVPDLVTKYTYNAASQVVTEDIYGATGAEHLVATRNYDDAGRLSNETKPGRGTTTFTYLPTANQMTTTFPTSGTRVVTTHFDGKLEKVMGSAVVPEYYSYEIASGGLRYERVNLGSLGSVRKRELWSDWVGRVTQTSRPGFNSNAADSSISAQPNFVETSEFEPGTGRLTKSTRTGYAPTLYYYDAMSQLVRSGLALGSGTALVLASNDRITDSDEFLKKDTNGVWWRTKETSTYFTAGSNQATLVGRSRERLTGFAGDLRSETQTTDANGLITTVEVRVNRADKTSTVTTTRPGFATSEVQTVVNGLATSVRQHDGLTYITGYDTLGRPNTRVDPRTGTTTTIYYPGTTLINMVQDALSPANNVATYSYDSAGRQTVVYDAKGNATRTNYNQRNLVVQQWGSGTYPVQYDYDAYGQRTVMYTYRAEVANKGWSASEWPAGVSTDSTTTWTFDEATGLVRKKQDAANRAVKFDYNARGLLATRVWARDVLGTPAGASNPVTTTYTYDNNTGELTDTTYNDGGVTPAVHQTYNRSGQLWKVRDGTASSATDYVEFIYNGTRPFLLDAVDYGTFYGSRVATQVYDSVFRPRGFTLGSATSLAADLAQTYTYDASDGRIATVSSSRNNDAGTNRTFTYGYAANCSLVETVTSGPYQVTRSYEAKRDLLTSQTTTWGGVARTRYDYHYNQLAQRDAAAQSGDAFADLGLPTFHRYIYNERGELSDATNYLGDESAGYAARSLGATSFPQLPGRHHLYGYDAIGNRTSASRTGTAGAPEIFTANKLNQYVSRENNYVHTAGTVADSSVKVAVGGGTSASGIGRLGRYWDAQVPVANIGQPWLGSLTVYAAQLGGAPNGGDLVHTETRSVQVAPAVQTFQYDDDGNLTHDRIWKYQWDAENRLVRMELTDEAIAAHLPRRVLEFTYDYLGRRVRKMVTTLHESTGAVMGDPDCRRFLYEEWNLIAEFRSTSASTLGVLARSYLWGLDLTGSRTASGGIGALLQITDHGASPVKTWLPTFDGNGNIAAYLDGVTGAVAAAYEYSPFGEPLRADAPDILAAELPFRFSTKFVDLETGLAYYGHRYFSPTLGRFINKDPIEEMGGLNLYGFCRNDGIGRWDYLGNEPTDRTNLLPYGYEVAEQHMPIRIISAIEGERNLPRSSGPTYRPENSNGTTYAPSRRGYEINIWDGIWDAAMGGLYSATLGHAVNAGNEAGQMYIDARESGGGALGATGYAISQGLGRVTGGMGLVEFYKGERVGISADGSLASAEFDSVADWTIHGLSSYGQATTTAIGLRSMVPGGKPGLPQPKAGTEPRYSWPGHANAAAAEEQLARTVHSLPDQAVVSWGDKIGTHGADVVSVNMKTGRVTLWDAKFRSGIDKIQGTKTFSDPARLQNTVNKATAELRANTSLPEAVRERAIRSLQNGTYQTRTVGFGNAPNSVLR